MGKILENEKKLISFFSIFIYEIKAQEELLIPENIQVSENINETTDCDLVDEEIKITPPMLANRNIIGAPTRCPEGYRADPTGKCRKILH